MLKITEKEINAITALSSYERYKYFIKRVADTEVMYSLKSQEGNWAISLVENSKLFPLWSAKEFAERCILDEWKGFEVNMIDINDFENVLLEFINSQKYLLNIFPVKINTGFVVDIVELAKDISEEMKKY